MKFWFDTEFIEDGKTIDLISIGIVSEDGREFYAENKECDLELASQWVRDNVIVHLMHEGCNEGNIRMTRAQIAKRLLEFIGTDKPEIWAYYADYDWVVLCQLFGTMMDLPRGWPMYCRDLKQLAGDIELPQQGKGEHHALSDARWTKSSWEWLQNSIEGK